MRFPRRNKIARSCDLDKNIKYKQIIDFKPTCYWYSLGKEWYNFWFKDNEMEKVKNQVVCEIKVKRNMFTTLEKKEKGKILVIDSFEDVKKLYKKYSKLVKLEARKYRLIDFNEVAKIYGGIEFRNYGKIRKEIIENKKLNQRRDYLSYFSLDVSSGCVWDLSLIDVEKKGKLNYFV